MLKGGMCPRFDGIIFGNGKVVRYSDDKIRNEDIRVLFNMGEAGHPYEVVKSGNAKDFCYSMHESLKFIASLKN